MSFQFDKDVVAKAQETAALEAFTSFATLKKNEAFKKVEESFAKRMNAAEIKFLKLVISIPSPKTYEYEAISAKKKEVKGEDFKFVWQILRGTNSYKNGNPKWNVCTITVADGKIKNIEFKLAPALLKKYQAAVVKDKQASNEAFFLDVLEDLHSFSTACEELDAYLAKSTKLQTAMQCLNALSKMISTESLDIAKFFTSKLCGENEKPSVETLGEKIKEVWEKVKAWVVGVFGRIKDLFNKVIGWTSVQKAKNDAVLTLCKTLGPGQMAELMKKAHANQSSNEGMSLSEVLREQFILDHKTVFRLLKEAAANIEAGVAAAVDITDFKRDLERIDNMPLAERKDAIDRIDNYLSEKTRVVKEMIESENQKFCELVLKAGGNYDNLYDAGWKDVASVEEVFKGYDKVQSECERLITHLDRTINEYNTILTQIGRKLDPNDALFPRKAEAVKATVRLGLFEARAVGMLAAHCTMIVEKCRRALSRAIS